MRLDTLSSEWELWLDAMSVFFVIGVLVLAALGMLLARDNAPKLLILLYILFNLGLFIITHYQPRYRLPLTILLLPYAAYGMLRVVELAVSRGKPSVAVPTSQTQAS